jgi:hypothetical protein
MGSRLRVGEWCPGCLNYSTPKSTFQNALKKSYRNFRRTHPSRSDHGHWDLLCRQNLLCTGLFFKKFEPARPLPLQGRAHRAHRRERWRPGGAATEAATEERLGSSVRQLARTRIAARMTASRNNETNPFGRPLDQRVHAPIQPRECARARID